MTDLVAEATRENFRDLVAEGQVLVDVWGPDCQPCLRMMPYVERLAEESGGSLKVVKLQADKARRLCMELKVMGLPAFLLFRDGEEVARINGPQVTEDGLTKWLAQNKDENKTENKTENTSKEEQETETA